MKLLNRLRTPELQEESLRNAFTSRHGRSPLPYDENEHHIGVGAAMTQDIAGLELTDRFYKKQDRNPEPYPDSSLATTPEALCF